MLGCESGIHILLEWNGPPVVSILRSDNRTWPGWRSRRSGIFLNMTTSLSRKTTSTVEVRFDAEQEDLAVLDAYNMATGTSRKDVMLKLLRDWSDAKRHEANVIVNVMRVIPDISELNRK